MDQIISQNIERIQEKIQMACIASRRSPNEIQLIAISKKKDAPAIESAYQAKQLYFGENYIQEALEKISQTKHLKNISWHFVGHLQSNKAKFIPGNFSLLHSLDSLSLAKNLNKEAERKSIFQPALVQINIDEEQTKSGIAPSELQLFLNKLNDFNYIRIEGLMTIPKVESPSRPKFNQLRKLLEKANQGSWYKNKLHTLSMGMTADFEDAILEGSTIIRVGTAIFGAR